MRSAILVLTILGVMTSRLEAVVIMFDQAEGDVFNQLDESGFRIEQPGNAFYVGSSTFCSPDCPDNGTRYAMPQDGWFPMQFTSLSGDPFAFRRLDLGERFVIFSGPPAIMIRGYGTDGTVVEHLFPLDQVNDGTGPLVDFQTFEAPPGFERLNLLEVLVPPPPLQGEHRYSLDNVVLESQGIVEVPALSSLGTVLFFVVLVVAACARLQIARAGAA